MVAKLQSEAGVNATLINPRYITGLDVDMLESLKKEHQVVVTLEDGVLDGGFGEDCSLLRRCLHACTEFWLT